MSRRSSFILGLPLRGGLRASSADQEVRFALSEGQQWDDFHASMYEHQQEFAEDEKSQWAGESMRISEFDRMMANMGVTFDTNEQRRDEIFLKAEKKQEKTFHTHEKVREEVFSDGECNRTRLFQQDQDRRGKRAEWYATIRETHFREGRMVREAICQDVEKALIKQFDDILRGQEEAFLSEERQRDELVKKLVDEEHTQSSTVLTSPVNPIKAFPYPTTEGKEFEVYRSPRHDPLSVRSTSRSPRPSDSVISFPGLGVMPKFPEPYVHVPQILDDDNAAPVPSSGIRPKESLDAGYTMPVPIAGHVIIPYLPKCSRSPSLIYSRCTSRSRSPSISRRHSRSRSPTIRYRSRSPHRPSRSNTSHSPPSCVNVMPVPTIVPFRPSIAPIITQQVSPSGSPSNIKSASSDAARIYFDERFKYSEEQRQQSFQNEEESREVRFGEAEAARDEGESSQRKLLKRKEKTFALKFRIMMAAHDQQFEEQEDLRARGETRRSQQAGAGVACRTHMFDQAISHIEKHYTAGNNLENDILNFMKRKVETLDRKQRAILAAARNQQAARFEKSQARRAKDLKTSLPSASVRASQPGSESYYPQAIATGIEPGFLLTSGFPHRARSYSPMRRQPPIIIVPSSHSSRSRARSPAIGFAPHAIIRGTHFQTSLPTPGSEMRRSSEGEANKSREETFKDFQRRRRYAFEKSQAKRDAAFESAAQRRQRAFSLKEARRQTQFEKLQKEGKEIFDGEEDERERIFRQAQNERGRKFSDNETSREVVFRSAESSRATEFILTQEQRDELFHSKQEGLRKTCFESEERRLLHIENWAPELLKEREQDQAGEYNSQELYRKEQFYKSLQYSVLKSSIRHRLEEDEE